MVKIGLLVAGFKGLAFLKEVQCLCEVAFVCSYPVKGTLDGSNKEIRKLCRQNHYRFIERTSLKEKDYRLAEKVFVAGWQYLIKGQREKLVIFHDSLLPKFRGFCPTVSALIAGEKRIGVSAIKASVMPDSGPIYEQAGVRIKYPLKIKDAYLLISGCYKKAARKIIKGIEKGRLGNFIQDEKKATYSVWRDDLDYYIDWGWDSRKIKRFVDAVGWPYKGACSMYRGKRIILDEVKLVREKRIENRVPGKILALNSGCPDVICKTGMVRILFARYENGKRVKFNRTRERLGKGTLCEIVPK